MNIISLGEILNLFYLYFSSILPLLCLYIMSVSLDSSQIAKDKRSNSIATAGFLDIGSLMAAKFSREFTGLLTAKSKKGAT